MDRDAQNRNMNTAGNPSVVKKKVVKKKVAPVKQDNSQNTSVTTANDAVVKRKTVNESSEKRNPVQVVSREVVYREDGTPVVKKKVAKKKISNTAAAVDKGVKTEVAIPTTSEKRKKVTDATPTGVKKKTVSDATPTGVKRKTVSDATPTGVKKKRVSGATPTGVKKKTVSDAAPTGEKKKKVSKTTPASTNGPINEGNKKTKKAAGDEIYSEPGAKVVKKKVVKKKIKKQPEKKELSYAEKNIAEIEKALGIGGDSSDKNTSPEDILKAAKSGNMKKSSTTNSSSAKTGMDKQTKKMLELLLLGVEAIVLIIVICVCINIYNKMKNKDFDLASAGVEAPVDYGDNNEIADMGDDYGDESSAYEGDAPVVQAGMSPVDVDNNNFSLFCNNVTVTLDTQGNAAALIYFTYTNKTATPLSMAEVFPPSVMQNGEVCETFASLEVYPEEFYNKDTQISDGQTINCCYTISLKDAISPISLTIHDNYETFADVGTTEISIQ